MSLFTSSKFASSAASGTDWRDTAKTVLEELEKAKTKDDSFNLGFLYISDHLAGDAESILNLFRSVLNIENWVGAVGIGVCGTDQAVIDGAGIAAMIGHFNPDDFCIFPHMNEDTEQPEDSLSPWLEKTDPMLIFAHGDPLSEIDPAITLADMEAETGGFIMGGLSSSRQDHIQFANHIYPNSFCGVAFSQNVTVATALSQGCAPVGGVHTITKGDENLIWELDSRPAMEVFEGDLKVMTEQKIGADPDSIMVDKEALLTPQAVPEEYKFLFKGEVHAAFPLSQSDQNDYLVRNIVGIDPDDGSMMVAHSVNTGESVLFVHRNEDTTREDLSKTLLSLRERVEKDHGEFKPKAALYVSCVARAFTEKPEGPGEIQLIREIIGDIPLAGFYAGGEISNARLYGYTGILTLFL